MCLRVGLVAGLAVGLEFEAAAFDSGRRNCAGLDLGASMDFHSCLVVFDRGCGRLLGSRTGLLFRYLIVAAEVAHENFRSCLVASARDSFHHPRSKTALLLHQSIAVVASADSDLAPSL